MKFEPSCKMLNINTLYNLQFVTFIAEIVSQFEMFIHF